MRPCSHITTFGNTSFRTPRLRTWFVNDPGPCTLEIKFQWAHIKSPIISCLYTFVVQDTGGLISQWLCSLVSRDRSVWRSRDRQLAARNRNYGAYFKARYKIYSRALHKVVIMPKVDKSTSAMENEFNNYNIIVGYWTETHFPVTSHIRLSFKRSELRTSTIKVRSALVCKRKMFYYRLRKHSN